MAQQGARRGRPPRSRDAVRAREVLDAAAEEFLTKGYDATSMQDIADAVGILKGSLYYYFRSKEDFLLEIIEPAYRTALGGMEGLSAEASPVARLGQFVRRHVHFIAENMRAFRIRLREFSQLTPDRQCSLLKDEDAYYATLIEILNDGVITGDFNPQLDVRLASVSMIGMLNSMTQWYSSEGAYTPDQLADHLSGYLVTAFCADAAVQRSGGVSQLRKIASSLG